MPRPPRVAHVDELPSLPVAGGARTLRPVRRQLGVGAFGVNAYSAAASGDALIEDHDETTAAAGRHEELYVVVRGHAHFTVDGDEIDAPAGTLVFVPDVASRRAAVAAAPDTVALVIGGRAGAAYEPSPWEDALLAAAFAASGDPERALALAGEALAAHPDHPHTLYNVACAEALCGERDRALEHLRRAVELEPQCGEWARADADFASLRDDPAFPAP